MTPDDRKSLDRLLAEDDRLSQQLQDLGGPRPPAASEAVAGFLAERAAYIKSEIANLKFNQWLGTPSQGGGPPVVLRQRDASRGGEAVAPLISEAERRSLRQ